MHQLCPRTTNSFPLNALYKPATPSRLFDLTISESELWLGICGHDSSSFHVWLQSWTHAACQCTRINTQIHVHLKVGLLLDFWIRPLSLHILLPHAQTKNSLLEIIFAIISKLHKIQQKQAPHLIDILSQKVLSTPPPFLLTPSLILWARNRCWFHHVANGSEGDRSCQIFSLLQ